MATQLELQPTLFETTHSEPLALTQAQRIELSHGAWLDVLPHWWPHSADLFAELTGLIPWRQQQRMMYDQLLAVPRLTYTYQAGQRLPHPALEQARQLLNRHYGPELGEEFVTAGCCLYRDGADSVAWHGDNIGRGKFRDTMVAIVSFGAARKLALRPCGGRTQLSLPLGHGDLAVMGGSCQRTWEHAIPKSARPVGPRISIQFRPRGVF